MKYVKCVLGLHRNTANYTVLEEVKKNDLWIESGKRAIRFEEKPREREDKKTKRTI